jgi:hypothetical protein
MSAIPATFIDGMIIPDVPPDWPNGMRVWMRPAECHERDQLPNDDDLSPAAIARRLELIDQIQPFLTPEEEEDWKKALAEQKPGRLQTRRSTVGNWRASSTMLRRLPLLDDNCGEGTSCGVQSPFQHTLGNCTVVATDLAAMPGLQTENWATSEA